MDATTLAAFRQGLYAAFTRAARRAVRGGRRAADRPAAAVVRRAVAGARLPARLAEPVRGAGRRAGRPGRAAAALRPATCRRPRRARGWSSPWTPARSTARRRDTLADRSLVYAPNTPAGASPVLPGWAFSTLVGAAGPGEQLDLHAGQPARARQRRPRRPSAPSSWRRSCRCCRPARCWSPTATTARRPGSRRPPRCRATSCCAPSAPPCSTAPPRRAPASAAQPRKDGARFQGSDPATHGPPDAQWQGTDARGQAVSGGLLGQPAPEGLPRRADHRHPHRAGRGRRHQARPARGLVLVARRALPPLAALPPPVRAPLRHRARLQVRQAGARCGPPRACGRRSSSRAGRIWSRRRIISSSSPARWPRSRGARGTRAAARRARSRCGGRWGGLSPRSGPRPARPDRAGNRRGGRRGRWSGPPRATRCAPRCPARPPDPATGGAAARRAAIPGARSARRPARGTRPRPAIV